MQLSAERSTPRSKLSKVSAGALSKKGIATPQKEIELVKQRLAGAERDYRERRN
jgi:hypothetical protein